MMEIGRVISLMKVDVFKWDGGRLEKGVVGFGLAVGWDRSTLGTGKCSKVLLE
jgi:hypothetical protein